VASYFSSPIFRPKAFSSSVKVMVFGATGFGTGGFGFARAVRKASRQGSGGLPFARQSLQNARIRALAAALIRFLPSAVWMPDLTWPPWPKHRGRGLPSSPTAHFRKHGRCTDRAHAPHVGQASSRWATPLSQVRKRKFFNDFSRACARTCALGASCLQQPFSASRSPCRRLFPLASKRRPFWVPALAVAEPLAS
jgi:hypothetical protein